MVEGFDPPLKRFQEVHHAVTEVDTELQKTPLCELLTNSVFLHRIGAICILGFYRTIPRTHQSSRF